MLQTTFDEAKERAEQRGDEYIYGAVETDYGLIPTILRLRYAPDGVLQYNNIMDTFGCASRSPVNIFKAKFSYLYDNGMHPALKRWLEDNGYVIKGRVVFDETFIEILSGTKPNGNSLKAPVDTIYKYGLIPECLPLEDGMTWEQYMNPKRITQKHLDMGKEFLRRFGINYEQVPLAQFPEALKDDLLDVAGHGWPAPINGIYPRTEQTIQHAFALLTDAIHSFDDSIPQIKQLAKNYKFFDWGYSLSITRQTPYPNETITLFETLQKYGLLAFFAEALKRLYAAPVPPVEPPITAPEEPPVPVKTSAERIVEAAKAALGKDMTPSDTIPDEVSCVIQLVTILPADLGISKKLTYTPDLLKALKDNLNFKPVLDPTPGTIVVSPTVGSNIGHCGIYIAADSIASNNSSGALKGKWTANYTRQTWINYFFKTKKLKGYLFAPR